MVEKFEKKFLGTWWVKSFVGSTEPQFFGGAVDIGDIFYVFSLFLTLGKNVITAGIDTADKLFASVKKTSKNVRTSKYV